MSSCCIFIPARLSSTRLPNKPLADINGKAMIVRVLQGALESNIKDVYIATGDQEIADVVTQNNGKAIITSGDHQSGTDRIYEAYIKLGQKFDFIINVQGDLPNFDPNLINEIVNVLETTNADIATLVTKIKHEEEVTNPNVVKAVLTSNSKIAKAIYFSRSPVPYNASEYFHHIGIYGYRAQALDKFINLGPSYLETTEKLEQLRALENNLSIYAAIVDSNPVGVDTIEDLEKVRNEV